MGFTNKEIAGLQLGVGKVRQKKDSIVARAEQFLLKVQCVLGLAKKPKRFRERISAIETAAFSKDSKRGNLPATRLKQNESHGENDMEQSRVELDACNARGAELEARVLELEK